MVRELWDRDSIRRLLYTYCRAIDRGDPELLKSVYHPDAIDAHGSFVGNAHEFAEFILKRLPEHTTYRQHIVMNPIIDLDGDRAISEASNVGIHRVPGGWDFVVQYFGEAYAARARETGQVDVDHEFIIGGRYLDVLEKRDGVWRILRRQITGEWNVCRPTREVWEGGRANYQLPGGPHPDDPVYSLTFDPPDAPQRRSVQ